MNCPIHQCPTICPKCIAPAGGKRTAERYPGKAREWGKLGKGKKHKFSPRPNRRKKS